MARKAILTDGTRTVDLIDIDTIIPQRGAFGKARYSPHQYDSARVVDDLLFVETWKLNVYGTSHDNLATQTELFKALLRDAWRYHNAEFDTPVYLEERTDGETNTRFATVWMCPEISDPDFFTHPFALDNVIEGYGVNIARFAWESLPQGIKGNRLLQTAVIGPDYSPAETDYDVDLSAEDGQLPHTMTGGLIGRPGAFGRAGQVAEALAANHVVNPRFENNIVDGWNPVGDGVLSHQVTGQYIGAGYLHIVAGTVDTYNSTADINVNNGETVTLSGRIKRSTATSDIMLRLRDTTTPAYRIDLVATAASNIWQYVSGSWTNNTGGAVNVRVFCWNGVNDSAAIARFDAIQLETKAYPTCYCDGSLGPGHSWAGAVHNSASARTAHVLRYGISDCSTKGTLGFRMMPIYEEDENANAAFVLSVSDGTVNNRIQFSISAATTVYRSMIVCGGTTNSVNLAAGDITRLIYADVVITWDLSDDEFKVFVDGAQIGSTQTGLGTPSAAWDRLYIGANRAGANHWSGWIDDLFLLDDVVLSDTEVALLDASAKKFQGHKATDLYLDFDGPKFNHLANFRDDVAVDEVWQFDGVAGWTNIGPDNNEWTWFTAAIAQNDAIYWGSTDNAFKHITGFFRTAGALTTTDLVLEYWNGGWVALTLGTHYTIYSADDLETFCERTGNYAINVDPLSDWASADPGNGVAGRYIRIRENHAAPVYAVKPVHAGQGTFSPRDNYIEVPSTVLGGDAKAKLLLRNRTPTGGDDNEGFANSSRILIGAKENPGTFVMSLNAGADNPAGWGIHNITDATTVADTDSPGGSRCHVSFATTEPMASRLRLSGTNKLADWLGEYRPMLRCQQIGGAVGDVSVKLQVTIGEITALYSPRFETKIIDLEGVSQGHEQVALSTNEPGGTLKLPWLDIKSADNFANTDVHFNIWASRVAGSAAVLRIYCLDSLPVDKWAVELDDPVGNSVYGNTALRGDNGIDIDAGLITDRTAKFINALANPVPVESWTRGGPPPQLNPETQIKLYFVNMHYPAGGTWGTGPLIATLGMHLTAEIYAHNQYYALRGNN